MKFGLRRACKNCPWRSDRAWPFFGKDPRGYERTQELAESLRDMHVFPCHKTATFEETEDGSTTEQVQHDNTQACAGALITMVKGEELGNLARIATRLGMFDPSILDLTSPTYGSLEEWSEAHNPQGDT